MQSAFPLTWLAPGLDQSPSSLLPAWYQFWSFRAAPPSQFRRGRRTDLSPRGRVPSFPEVPGRALTPTPLNGYTSTLLCLHRCRHGRSSIRLQAIHMHHCERLFSFPAHDDPSSIQYFGVEHRAKPRELQLRSTGSFQRYVVNPYQLSSLILLPLDLTVVVKFLMQRRPLQPLTGVPVRRSQPSLECGHVLAHRGFFLLRPQGRPIHGLDRKSCLLIQHHHIGGHPRASLWRCPVAHQDEGHELVPLLLRLPARRLQAPAQCPKASFHEPFAPGVIWCSPSLVYPE